MDLSTNHSYRELIGRFSRPSKIAIITHVNPDADAVGSSLGLAHFLNAMHHQADVILPNDAPEFLHWLPGYQAVKVFEKSKPEAIEAVMEADFIFLLDFNSLSRIEEIKKYLQKSKGISIHIDHHPDNKKEADYQFKSTQVSSTAEIIYEWIQAFPGSNNIINKAIADCLYTGIMTDTVDFRYNVYQRTFHILSEMLDYGINIEDIHSKVYDKFSEKRMQMLGYALYKKMTVLPEYQTAYIVLNEKDLEAFDYSPGDTEGFVNLPLSIQGISFSALFVEKDNKIKISFRSKGRFAVNIFASQHFQGGGHQNAAGGSSDLSLNDTLAKFNSLLARYKEKIIVCQD